MDARRTTLAWRRDVVPRAAELVVGHDDHRVLRAAAALDRLQQRYNVLAAASHAGVAGVLVVRCDGLDEADRIELAGLRRGVCELDEFLFVTQVRPPCRTGSKGCVVVERIVMELELLVRAERVRGVRARVWIRAGRSIAIRPARRADFAGCIRPPARVPRPTNTVHAKFVPDCRPRLWR